METDKVEDNNQAEVISEVTGNEDDNTETTTKKATKESLSLRIAEVLNLESDKLSDVDKFKRRLIRSIARYMMDKVPEEEMWEKLQKDTDCDCHVLWKRMRSLTYKKLRRLLSVGDRWESVAKVARLTSTDWLLFDLVLVHEKIDFIGQDTMKENEQEPKVLQELFELVKKYNIEQLDGEDLVSAWAYLALEYNRRGRHCSPMLLQRRWYQLKELARIKFYSFWFAYGGAASKLEKAWQQKPTNLQAAIAKTYKFIVTDPFPEWEELISNKKVVLREDFENLTKEQPNNNKNVSDVQIIETPVETIELDEESDLENGETSQVPSNDTDLRDGPNASNEELEISIGKIKSEATIPIMDVQAFETMHIPIQKENSPMSLLKSNYALEPTALSTHEIPIEIHDEVLPKITSVVGGVDLLASGDVVDNKQKLVNNNKNIDMSTEIINVNESDNVRTSLNNNTMTNHNDNLKSNDETQDFEVPLDDLLIIDDGIALEDDDDVYEEENNGDLLQNIKEESKVCLKENGDDKIDDTPKFDYKLLLTPVVYTRKLNDMSVFKFIDFQNVHDKRIIECCYIESKPKIELCNSEQQKSKENESAVSKSIEHADEGDSNSSAYIDDITRIKYCSWLLRKPKNRNYNPIKLCKNPDFNTRLKRLNAGFLSCESNRLLLKECKPLTIDVHKSFERKLIHGTMYLKDGKFTDSLERTNTVCTKALDMNSSEISGSRSVEVSMSYIVPIISSTNTLYQKIDNTDKNVVNQYIDVNKSISTSSSDKKLLTVEITPIKADNIDNRPPVEIVAKRSVINSDSLQEHGDVNQDQTSKELDEQDNSLENHVSIDLVTNNIQRKMSKHRFQNILGKTLINGPKHYRFGYSINNPTQEPLTWNRGWKQHKNTDVFGGVLLASDTLEKMLNLLFYGDVDEKKKKKNSEKSNAQEKKDLQEKIFSKKKVTKTSKTSTEKEVASNTIIVKKNKTVKKRRKRKPRVRDSSKDLPTVQYCCWAQEKIATKREPKMPHYCPNPICLCCCRDNLLAKSLEERAKESWIRDIEEVRKTRLNKMESHRKTEQNLIASQVKSSSNLISDLPIVLSDDDDDIENTAKACKTLCAISDNVCSNSYENDSLHLNMEKSTNNMDQNQEKPSKEEISVNPQISAQNNLLEEDTSLTSQPNNTQISPSCKVSLYPKPLSILKKRTSNIPVHTNNPLHSISNQYNNHHKSENIKISKQHDSNELPHSTPLLYPLKDSSKHSSPNDSTIVLIDTLLNPKPSTNSNSTKLPIFLGENNILLCASKPLSNLETNVNKSSEEAKTILPDGVQIVLLPNGELTLSIEPGKNFEIGEINKFSEILAAVAAQMQSRLLDKNINVDNSSERLGLKNVDNTINSLPDNENVCKTLSDEQTSSRLSMETINLTTPTAQHIEYDHNAGLVNTETVLTYDSVGEMNKKSCNTHDDHNNESAKNSTDLALPSNKKSILHDLMEMSGISESDAVSDDKTQLNLYKETMLPSTPVSTVTLPNNKLAQDTTLSDSINTNFYDTPWVVPSLVSKVLEKCEELSIVSSVVELRAACKNKFPFYKMDTVTGQIVPINIKLKKSDKRNKQLCSSIESGPVIDLTDDTNITIQETAAKEPESNNSISLQSQIKPIKLIRSIRPRKKLKKSLLLNSDDTTSITPKKRLYSILKQNLLQLEREKVGTDLNKITTHKNDINEGSKTNEVKDSDSDDEPLAKIAKRQRDIGDTDYPHRTASPENLALSEDVDDDLTEYLMPEFLETMDCESNNEETEENCILGV